MALFLIKFYYQVTQNMKTSGKFINKIGEKLNYFPLFMLKVSLFKLIDSHWVLINESATNSDGRCAELLQRDAFRNGRYKLHFNVDKYFKSIRTSSIYPFIEVSLYS